MRGLNHFRLITFDVTNTLLRFRSSKGKQYGEIGALFGVRCDNNELVKNFKTNWYKMNKDYPNFGVESIPPLEWQHWWRQLISATFAESGAPIPAEKLENFSNHLLELYKTTMCWQHCNASVDLLKYLRKTKPDGKIGVIANFDPRLDELLRNTKLDKLLDFAINSHAVRLEKPSAAIYARAMAESKLSNLRPDECLHIGDGPTTDYLGARKAGWYAALVHEKSYDEYLLKKYGESIDRKHVYPSLYDFQKKLIDDAVIW